MKAAGVLCLLLCVVLCSQVHAGLGKPLPTDSLSAGERRMLADKAARSLVPKALGERIGEEKALAAIERLSDRDLELLARNSTGVVGGGVTFAELIVQLVLIAMVAGVLILLLIVLGVVALFAGGAAASSSRGAPMGKAQYDRQRRETEEMKEIGKPAGQGK